MKLLTSSSIQFIALTVLGLMVFLAAARYLYKEGFQDLPANLETSPEVMCKGYQLAIEQKRRELQNAKTDDDRKYHQDMLSIFERQMAEANCSQYADKIAQIPTPPPAPAPSA
jgi:hypothetical protein